MKRLRQCHPHRKALAAACVVVAIFAAACSSNDDEGSDPTAATGVVSTESEAESTTVESTPDATETAAPSTESIPEATTEETVSSTPVATEPDVTEPDGDSPPTGGELTVIQLTNPSSLDPAVSSSGGDHITLYPIFDRLINFDPVTMEAVPGLAESWEYPEPQTLVLTLHDGVMFHDGTMFDSEAVKYNLDRMLTLETSTSAQSLSMIDSVEATGPTEVTIHLSRPDSSLLLILADKPGMMISPAAAEESGDEFGFNPVGTGPFTFVEWVQNDRAVLAKNPNYWQDGLPYLDQVTIRYISDPQTVVNSLLTGEADMALRINAADVPALEEDDDITVNINPSLGMDLCYFNFSREPFSSREARLAVNYAIDRNELNEGLWFGLATVTNQFLPPSHWASDPALQETFVFDPDRANELLAEAGFDDGVDITGVAFDAPGQARKNEIIQAQLAEVGINMTFDVMAVSAAISAFAEDLTYDIFCSGTPGTPDPSQTAGSLFSSTSFINAGKYASPGMDEALAEAGAGSTLDERAAAFSVVHQLSQEDAMFVPLLNYPDITPTRSSVGGFVPNLLGKPDVSFLWRAD